MKKTLLTLLCTLSLFSCNQKSTITDLQNSGSGSCSGEVGSNTSTGPLFKIDGQVVSKSDLPGSLKQYVYTNENEAYTKNTSAYKELALRVYLAKQQGKFTDIKSVPPALDLLKAPNASEAEAKSFFEENKARMGAGVKFEQLKDKIIQHLTAQKMQRLFGEKFAEIESKGLFKLLLSAPMAPKLDIPTKNFPTTGNINSKVKVTEISDYLCGHCQQAHPAVKMILKNYKDRISFTQINFSLRPQGLSGTYARGAHCAQLKGDEYFWKFHHEAFVKTSVPHDHGAHGDDHDATATSKSSLDKVNEVAKKAGLNVDEFQRCVLSEKTQNHIDQTNAMLSSKGVNGTPIFIINGKKLAKGVHELEHEIKEALK